MDAEAPDEEDSEYSEDSERDPTVRVPLPEPTAGVPSRAMREPGSALASGILEFVGGGAGGVGLGLASAYLFASSCEEDTCIAGALFMGGLGAIAGVPLGVYLTGSLLGREGGFGATLLGFGVGGAAGLLGAGALSNREGGEELGVALLALPLLGAVLGYELSHAASVSDAAPGRPLRRAAPRWTPVAGVTPRGGFMGGLAGHF
jgi:hypothetical protein